MKSGLGSICLIFMMLLEALSGFPDLISFRPPPFGSLLPRDPIVAERQSLNLTCELDVSLLKKDINATNIFFTFHPLPLDNSDINDYNHSVEIISESTAVLSVLSLPVGKTGRYSARCNVNQTGGIITKGPAQDIVVEGQPDVPKNVQCVFHARTTLNCTWDNGRATGSATNWTLLWTMDPDASPVPCQLLSATMDSCKWVEEQTVAQIQSGTTMLVQVIAQNTFWTKRTSKILVDPFKLVKPDPVTHIDVQTNASSVLILWPAPKFSEEHTIQWWNGTCCVKNLVVLGTGIVSVVIEDMAPNINYTVCIKSKPRTSGFFSDPVCRVIEIIHENTTTVANAMVLESVAAGFVPMSTVGIVTGVTLAAIFLIGGILLLMKMHKYVHKKIAIMVPPETIKEEVLGQNSCQSLRIDDESVDSGIQFSSSSSSTPTSQGHTYYQVDKQAINKGERVHLNDALPAHRSFSLMTASSFSEGLNSTSSVSDQFSNEDLATSDGESPCTAVSTDNIENNVTPASIDEIVISVISSAMTEEIVSNVTSIVTGGIATGTSDSKPVENETVSRQQWAVCTQATTFNQVYEESFETSIFKETDCYEPDIQCEPHVYYEDLHSSGDSEVSCISKSDGYKGWTVNVGLGCYAESSINSSGCELSSRVNRYGETSFNQNGMELDIPQFETHRNEDIIQEMQQDTHDSLSADTTQGIQQDSPDITTAQPPFGGKTKHVSYTEDKSSSGVNGNLCVLLDNDFEGGKTENIVDMIGSSVELENTSNSLTQNENSGNHKMLQMQNIKFAEADKHLFNNNRCLGQKYNQQKIFNPASLPSLGYAQFSLSPTPGNIVDCSKDEEKGPDCQFIMLI